MDRKALGIIGELCKNFVEHCSLNTGVDMRQNANRLGRLGNLGRHWSMRTSLIKRYLQLALEIVERLFSFFECDVTTSDQGFNIQLTNTALFSNGLVHEWLRVTGVVTFVMAMAAVTHHVNNNVFMETLTIFPCESSDANASFGVVAIDVEDRCLDCLGDVTAIQRRTSELWRCCETNLVVNDEVNGSANAISVDIAHA